VGIWLEGQTKIIASRRDFPLTQDERIRQYGSGPLIRYY
jgi:hypothetical protein